MQNMEPKVIKSFVHFFRYKRYKELQQHYIGCWQKVASMFKDNPHVLGYDLMNEPHGGKIIKTLAGGFERTWLAKFYKRLIPAIRQVDTAHYIFFEPRSLGVNFGMRAHLPAVKDSLSGKSKLVYAPHCYLAFVDVGGDYKPKNKKNMDKWFTNRERELKKHHSPMLIGEFGLSPKKKDFDIYLHDLESGADKDHASWTYWCNDHGGWCPFNLDGSPSPILNELLRVYPEATAGTIVKYSYDPAKREFEMEYASNPDIKMPTEIAIPKVLYPKGYNLKITGCDKWATETNAATNSLKLFVKDNGTTVKVHITSK
jgi:endoglycosylceramidase